MIIQLSSSLWAKTKKEKLHIFTVLTVIVRPLMLCSRRYVWVEIRGFLAKHLRGAYEHEIYCTYLRKTCSQLHIQGQRAARRKPPALILKGFIHRWGREGATRHSGGSLHSTPGTLATGTWASWSQSLHQAGRCLGHTTLFQVASLDCLHNITREAKRHMWGWVCARVRFYVHTFLYSLQCA